MRCRDLDIFKILGIFWNFFGSSERFFGSSLEFFGIFLEDFLEEFLADLFVKILSKGKKEGRKISILRSAIASSSCLKIKTLGTVLELPARQHCH